MDGEVTHIDLRALDLAPGAAERRHLRVPPVTLRLGGEDYVTEPASPEVDLEVSRSLSGLHMRLRTSVVLEGPCFRCLAPSRVPITVDATEFEAEGRDGEDFDDDFDSVYVEDRVLDVALWARDSIAEAVPATILHAEGCAGLCPICGADRNEVACDCAEDTTDPRWDALRAVAERLEKDPGQG